MSHTQRRATDTTSLLAMWLIFAPYIVISLCHVVLLALDSPAAAPTKLWLMPLLILPLAAFAARMRPRIVGILLVLAVFFSWLGDGAGELFPEGPVLPLMLAFFGIAHLFYMLVLWRFVAVRRFPLWAGIFALWYVAMLVILGPHTGALFFGVAAYGLVLGGTAALASRCGPLIAIGGVFFLASATILAFRIFLPEIMDDWTSPAVMFTYTLGQGLIIAGAIRHIVARTALGTPGTAPVVNPGSR